MSAPLGLMGGEFTDPLFDRVKFSNSQAGQFCNDFAHTHNGEC